MIGGFKGLLPQSPRSLVTQQGLHLLTFTRYQTHLTGLNITVEDHRRCAQALHVRLSFKMKRIAPILIALFMVGCSANEVRETSQSKACTRDQECWCQGFTGAKFLDSKDKSYCCTPDKIDGLFCKAIKACAVCFYD